MKVWTVPLSDQTSGSSLQRRALRPTTHYYTRRTFVRISCAGHDSDQLAVERRGETRKLIGLSDGVRAKLPVSIVTGNGTAAPTGQDASLRRSLTGESVSRSSCRIDIAVKEREIAHDRVVKPKPALFSPAAVSPT